MVAIEMLAFTCREPVAEDNAVDVVSLVLEAAPKGATSSDFDRVAVLIVSTTGGEGGAREVSEGAGKGQTAFAVLDELPVYPFRKVDNRIADDARAPFPYLVGAVVNEHRKVNAYLLSCQSSTIRSNVGSEHVRQQFLEIAAETCHRSRRRMKHREPQRTIGRAVPRRRSSETGMAVIFRSTCAGCQRESGTA